MSTVREAAFRIFIGTSGTRKTTDIKRLLTSKRRNLVIPSGRDDTAWHEFEPLEWRVERVEDQMMPGKMVPRVIIPQLRTFKGTRILHVDGKQQLFDAVIDPTTGARDCRLVLDDFRNYIYSSGNLRHDVSALFRNRRHRMLDIFMACHSADDVSRQILALNPTLVIGYTTSMPTDTSIAKMPKGEEFLRLLEHARRVNESRPETERHLKFELQM